MKNYKFLSHVSELSGKQLKDVLEINISGIITQVFVTEDDYVVAKSFESASIYDMEYVHEEQYKSIEKLLEKLDHELIDVLITEEQYEEIVEREEEKYQLEELARIKAQEKQKYEEYLILKKQFE